MNTLLVQTSFAKMAKKRETFSPRNLRASKFAKVKPGKKQQRYFDTFLLDERNAFDVLD